MGYDSHFMLTFQKKEGTFSDKDVEALSEEIRNASDGYEPDETNYKDGSLYMGFYDVHWYDFLDEMKVVMKNHPELSLRVTREGEDHNDTEVSAWPFGADRWYDDDPVSFTAPIRDGSTKVVAVFRGDTTDITFMGVPADSSDKDVADTLNGTFMEELGRIPDYTWRFVEHLNLFGTDVFFNKIPA